MGFFTHLGGMRLGTVKEGSSANLGNVVVSNSFSVTYAADGTVTTGFIIPAGARIQAIYLDTTTAFNAATTNTLKLGTTSGGAELLTATACGPVGRAAITTTLVTSALSVGTSDITVYATYNQSGTAATTGAGTITILWAVRNADGTSGNTP